MEAEVVIAEYLSSDGSFKHFHLVGFHQLLDSGRKDVLEFSVAGGHDFPHLRDHIRRLAATSRASDQAGGRFTKEARLVK